MSADKIALEVRELHAFYGKSHILQGVNLYVKEGEIVALLGRNGAGRSTTVKAIMGMVDNRGEVLWRESGLASYDHLVNVLRELEKREQVAQR
mgnify:CR=1 FL=1